MTSSRMDHPPPPPPPPPLLSGLFNSMTALFRAPKVQSNLVRLPLTIIPNANLAPNSIFTQELSLQYSDLLKAKLEKNF